MKRTMSRKVQLGCIRCHTTTMPINFTRLISIPIAHLNFHRLARGSRLLVLTRWIGNRFGQGYSPHRPFPYPAGAQTRSATPRCLDTQFVIHLIFQRTPSSRCVMFVLVCSLGMHFPRRSFLYRLFPHPSLSCVHDTFYRSRSTLSFQASLYK
jgi:hypothetical protein